MSKGKVTAEQLEASAWAAALASPAVVDKVPPGWHTASQLAALLEKPPSTIGKLLLSAIRAGKCERQNFRITTGSLTRPVPHYRLKP
jgi:hypothetical protein